MTNRPSVPDAYALRNLVGRWFRIRAEHVHESVGIAGHMGKLDKGFQHSLLLQLAADAEHSDLLVRLLQGEEPLEFEQWLEERNYRAVGRA